MPGPTPKPAALRQHRLRHSTAAPLTRARSRRKVPLLPACTRGDWHPNTLAWWPEVWRSPMAAEYLPADIHGLYLLADLVDLYWRKPTPALAAEIRLQRMCFGLTPIDRRRLQWEVEQPGRAPQRPIPTRAAPEDDPRRILRVLESS